MKDNTKERIRNLIDHLGWTPTKFAREAKIDRNSALQYYNSQTDPSEATVNTILENLPFVNEIWLKTGEGLMIKSDSNFELKDPDYNREYGCTKKLSKLEQCQCDLERAKKTIDQLLKRIEDLEGTTKVTIEERKKEGCLKIVYRGSPTPLTQPQHIKLKMI